MFGRHYLTCFLVSAWISLALLAGQSNGDLVGAIGEGQPVNEFSGVQGQDGWWYGYWVVDSAYSHLTDFVAFAGGDTFGVWNGTTQMWNGLFWDRNVAADAPWTALTNTRMHPNDPSPGPEEYPVVRYLVDSEAASMGGIRVSGFFRNEESAGDGAIGRVFLNGVEIWNGLTNADVATIPTVEIAVSENDVIDFMLDTGPSFDGADSTTYSFAINNFVLAVPEPSCIIPIALCGLVFGSKRRRSGLAA